MTLIIITSSLTTLNFQMQKTVGRGRKAALPLLNQVRLDSCFISDVNGMDGTVMAPSACFTKIWKMKNTGNLAWPLGTQLVPVYGKKFSNALSVDLEVRTRYSCLIFFHRLSTFKFY